MRGREEIEQVYDGLGGLDDILHEPRDSFRYGMLIGKLVALGWVVGEEETHDLFADYDFEDWSRKRSEMGKDIGDALRHDAADDREDDSVLDIDHEDDDDEERPNVV